MPRNAPYNRDAALKAAMSLFWRKGYHATSLKDLEQALAMKPGSIYAAFQSKETLFRLALAEYFEQNTTALDQTIETARSPLQGLADYVRAQVVQKNGTRAPACMLAKTVMEMADDPGPLGDDARENLRKMADRFAKIYRSAQATGELETDADPDRLARRLQVKLMGLTIFALRDDDPDMLHELADDLAQEVTHPDHLAA